MKYVIQNTMNYNLFWSNENGWVDLWSADTFEDASSLRLPMEGSLTSARAVLKTYERLYKEYLKDVSNDPDFDIKMTEDFYEWVSTESWEESK